MIEKHITLNKELQGPDHKFALEPNELKLMINSIRNAEKAQGDGNKRVLDVEQELKQFASRSIQAIKDIKKGEELIENYNFQVLSCAAIHKIIFHQEIHIIDLFLI